MEIEEHILLCHKLFSDRVVNKLIQNLNRNNLSPLTITVFVIEILLNIFLTTNECNTSTVYLKMSLDLIDILTYKLRNIKNTQKKKQFRLVEEHKLFPV